MNRLINGRMSQVSSFQLSDLDILSRWDPNLVDQIFSNEWLEEWRNIPNNSFQRLSYQALDRFILKRQLEICPIQFPDEILVEDNTEIDCSICLEPISYTMILLECSHKFHSNCIRTWNKNSCPYCRKTIDKSHKREYDLTID